MKTLPLGVAGNFLPSQSSRRGNNNHSMDDLENRRLDRSPTRPQCSRASGVLWHRDGCDWPEPQAGRRNAGVDSTMHERRSTCAVIVPRAVARIFQPSTDGMARRGPFVQDRALASKIKKTGPAEGRESDSNSVSMAGFRINRHSCWKKNGTR